MENEKSISNSVDEVLAQNPEREDGPKEDIAREMGETAVDNAMEVSDKPKVIGEIRERETETSYTQDDIKRIAEATGRIESDPEVIKLNLALKYDQFIKYKKIWDNNEAKNEATNTSTMIQEGSRQDIATAQNELEEAMYLYEPKFAKYDEQERRNNLRYDSDRESLRNKIRGTKDLDDKHELIEEFKKEFSDKNSREYNLERKRAGEGSGLASERKDSADLSGRYGHMNIGDIEFGASKLENITNQIKGSEIYQTYDLEKTADSDIKGRRQAGRVADGDFVLIPHKPEKIQPENDPPELPPIPPELPPIPPELPPIPPELPPIPPELPPERYIDTVELEGQYKQAKENFAEALAKRRGIFGGGFGHAEALAKAKDDYAKMSAELLASKYEAKIKELEGRGDLSDEEKLNELNADAIKNKLDQDFELNDKIKYQIENGNLFRKIFNSVDRLPKVLRPLARIAGSNGVGTLAWAGVAAVGLANPVAGVVIAGVTVAAFTRPGYGGSAFEAHKDVLSAASDEKDSVVVDNGLARKEGESREDYRDRLDDMSKKFFERTKVNRAIQGLSQKERMQEALESIKDPHDKDEMARVFAGMNDYTSKEQIELSNYDKNKNRITTGVLSVAAAALSISSLHWGKMAVGRFGGAANYSKINMKLNPEEQPAGTAVDSENTTPNNEQVEPGLPLTNPLEVGPPPLEVTESGALGSAQPAEQQSSGSEQPFAPEIGSSEVDRGYSEDQYKQAVNGVKKALQDSRDGVAYASSPVIQRNLGVGVRFADDILARMRRDGVIDGSGKVR